MCEFVSWRWGGGGKKKERGEKENRRKYVFIDGATEMLVYCRAVIHLR